MDPNTPTVSSPDLLTPGTAPRDPSTSSPLQAQLPTTASSAPGQPPPTLETLFCNHFGCPPVKYANRAFRHCLYLHARLAAPLLNLVWRDLFALDFELLRQLGAATHMGEVNAALATFNDANIWPVTFLRGVLRLRVSGRRATRMAHVLFAAAQNGPRQP